MNGPRPGLVWVIAAVGILAAIVSYGNSRADNALADLRRDKLNEAHAAAARRQAARNQLELARQAERDSLARVVEASRATEDSLEALADSLESVSDSNLARLGAILADSGNTIPDTVRVLVGVAIAGLDRELRACEDGWIACRRRAAAAEATSASLRLDLVAKDSTIAESDSLLTDYRTQLDDALRTSFFDLEVIKLGTRVAALYAVVRTVIDLLTAKE